MSEYPAPSLGALHGPWGPPAPPQQRKPRRWIAATLISCAVVLSLLFAGAGGALAFDKAETERRNRPDAAHYLAGVDPKARDAEVAAVLDKRARAVLDKDKAAFLADLDKDMIGLVDAQTKLFDNLTKMPFAAFSYQMEVGRFELIRHEAILARYRKMVFLPAVTNKFRITGVDTKDTATPYVPMFGRVKDRWVLIGEASDSDVDARMPAGYGAQPWQSDPIAVRSTENLVMVYSPQDEGKADGWVQMIEAAISEVKRFRPEGWSGKVFAIAVRDTKLYYEYLGATGDKFAAFATTRPDRISAWSTTGSTEEESAGSLVMMNPTTLDKSSDGFGQIMVHEVTHVAMAPTEKGNKAPRWLIEGIAEFVESGAKTNMQIKPSWAREHLSGKDLSTLPDDAKFYADSGENYTLAWLANMLIAEKYGNAKLIALHDWFLTAPDTKPETRDRAMREVLGVSMEEFTKTWRQEVKDSIAG